ncbi:MAG: RagB/SusD family nutrient uptake outer membrane protein [Bacteroidota bacterium]
MTTIIKKYLIIPIAFILFMWQSGCKKLIESPIPTNVLISSSVFLDSLTTQAAVNGMYRQYYMSSGSSYFDINIQLDPARLADETYAVSNAIDNFSSNTLTPAEGNVNTLWNNSYTCIYTANNIIQSAESSPNLTSTLKKQVVGEALFMRSLLYFYLINYYGDVPLVLSTDITITGSLPRTPVATVYSQIVSDLLIARNSLSTTFSWSQNDRTRANSWAASALLARVYLYQGNWSAAEAEATRVINNTALFKIVPDPNNVFLKNSTETIFAFYANFNGFPQQTLPGSGNYLTGTQLPLYAIRPQLLSAFESGDTRATKWIGTATFNNVVYKFPYKYKAITNTNTELQICLRLSELYLIRSEARMQQGNLVGDNSAQSDLNVIRNRAGLGNTAASVPSLLAPAIAQERRIELFVEWGDRWLNLKRTNMATAVLSLIKPQWKPTAVLYPIPQTAILTNPSLIPNPGY